MSTSAVHDPSYWHCDGCDRVIQDGEYRYNCTVCDDFDHCEQCNKTNNPPHSHPLVRELSFGRARRNSIEPVDMAAGVEKAFDMYRNRRCMGMRDVDENNPSVYLNSYSWLTYQTVGERTRHFAHGLRRLIEPRGYLGICAANRPEWLMTDFACMLQSIVNVPIYCLFDERETAYVINNTQVSVVVCDGRMLPRFLELGTQCPSLRHIVCMDPVSKSMLKQTDGSRPTVYYMGDIEKLGTARRYPREPIAPSECLTIIYTSGSSGFPKGAIISEEAYRFTFSNWFIECNSLRVTFSYRPLAWAADRDAAIGAFIAGGQIGFSTGDVNRLMEELALVRPTQFSAPPSIWNKIYAEFKAALSAVNAQHSAEASAIEEERLLEEFSKLIPKRCKSVAVGSAKISPTVWNFMKRCFRGCRVNESYGITECGSVAYNNFPEGSIQYRLESVPEMGYTTDDKPFPRGEILTKTTQMFSGYINNPEETREALTDDGFFRTGDFVELRVDSHGELDLRVIDRKKSFFKLSQGQFVSPEYLQSIYLRSPFVEQIYIHGDLLSDSVTAVVVPNRAHTQKFVRKHNIADFDMSSPNAQFCDAVLQDIRSIARKESLRPHEIPSHLIIDFEPFTPENGLLTSSFKPCRHKLAARYGERLKAGKTIDQRLRTVLETTDVDAHVLLPSGGDSLAAVRLSRLIETNFGVPVPTSVLFEPTMTVQRLSTLIKDPSQMSAITRSVVPQMLNDARLDLTIDTNKPKKIVRSPSMVFITGTTGFVGAFLLAELLTVYPLDCRFTCLVRCELGIDPIDRIQQTMLFYQIWRSEYRERIVALRGDLSQTNFGFTRESYKALADRIDIIFHCGATVNFMLPYSKLYGPNVCGTREIIRLATSPAALVPVQYISTVSVLSPGVHQEISIDKVPANGLVSGYGQSKWVAEKLITRARELGLPVVIYRLGSICAATRTGACNRHDIHTLLFAAMMKLGCYPQREENSHVHGLAVDFTAKSIVYLSRLQPDTNGQVYHVVNPVHRVRFKDIVYGMRRCGVRLEPVSVEEWQTKSKTIMNEDSSLESAGDFLLKGDLHEAFQVSAEQFSNAISRMKFPSFDQDYVFQWMNFILHHTLR